ncbi:MAG: hypothetical protein ACAI44_17465 [Candidatus Sericytochromatia bacterium]
MKKALMSLVTLALAAGSFVPSQAQSGPKVIQRSVIMNTNDHGNYWPDPNKEPIYGKAAWTPNNLNLNFLVEGPLGPGSKLSMEFLKPDGKPWVSVNCMTPELEAGQVASIEECDDIDEKKALPVTGMIGMLIRLKNELEGTNTVLYKGRLKVGTYTAKIGKTVQHFIDEDWRLPTAYVTIDRGHDEYVPPLIAYFWFKGRNISSGDLVAYLYHNGKQIAINTDNNGSAQQIVERNANLEPGDPKKDYSYQLWNFYFTSVRGWAQNASNYNLDVWHMLDRNPGNYEIKVLRKGKLARVASFSVGGDGKIVAPGSVELDGANNDRILIPTKVVGDTDGAWDKAAYKTEIYYGNPGPGTSGILAP